MNLPDFHQSGILNSIREKMGAPLMTFFDGIEWVAIIPETVEVIMAQLNSERGIEVSDWKMIATPVGVDQILIGPDGERVIVYIPEAGHKYHITNCSTLKSMYSAGRYNRYVVSKRGDGRFTIDIGRSTERIVRLEVCLNCLSGIRNNRRYSKGDTKFGGLGSKFDVKTWMSQAVFENNMPKPRYTEIDMPKNEYTKEFPEISRRLKEGAGYRCSECYLNLSAPENRKYLHVHHKNGLKFDNGYNNLQVLCIRCHAKKYQHSRMQKLIEYQEFIARFR
jgi:hypothetical protein